MQPYPDSTMAPRDGWSASRSGSGSRSGLTAGSISTASMTARGSMSGTVPIPDDRVWRAQSGPSGDWSRPRFPDRSLDPALDTRRAHRDPDEWAVRTAMTMRRSAAPRRDMDMDADDDQEDRADPRHIAWALRHPSAMAPQARDDERAYAALSLSAFRARPTMLGRATASPELRASSSSAAYADASPGLPRLSMLLHAPATQAPAQRRYVHARHDDPPTQSMTSRRSTEYPSPASPRYTPQAPVLARWRTFGAASASPSPSLPPPPSNQAQEHPHPHLQTQMQTRESFLATPQNSMFQCPPTATSRSLRDDLEMDAVNESFQLHRFEPADMNGTACKVEQSPSGSNQASSRSGSGDEGDKLTASGSVASSSTTSIQGKNSRYLREMDRRAILSRLANGEKQSTLAKEYQVSRAAICNLNKHRDEVLSRSDQNPLAKHPKKRKLRAAVVPTVKPKVEVSPSSEASHNTSTASSSPNTFSSVLEIKSRAVQLLLTTLRSQSTSASEFHRAAERIMRLLVEEALATVPTKPVEVDLNEHTKTFGVSIDHPPCGLSMEQDYSPMMETFHLIEPNQPSGYIRFDKPRLPDEEDSNGPAQITLLDAHLPPTLAYHNLFILDVACVLGQTVCAVIQSLKDRGAVDSMIHIVSLFISSEVIAMVQGKFPRVHIVTAMIHSRRSYKAANEANLAAVLDRFDQVYSVQASNV